MAAEAAGVMVELGGRLAADARIGAYRVKALIGEGAMGEVYLADDLVLGRRVALKLVRTGGLDSRLVDRFFEEARATAAFAHPHIVTLYAVGNHDGRPYLALEFLDGESLRARLGAGPFSVGDALRTIRAIAEAVAEAHGRGILHADLKPENVMLPRDGRLRVVDFGLARLSGAAGTAASGTPSYMAPERWSGASPTEAIDVWSLGVMLFELCTGARPWTDAELARLAFGRDDPPVPASDARWMPVVAACLKRSPADRPTAPRLVQWLTELLEPSVTAVSDTACPFPGLTAFRRDDSVHFFGRVAELDFLMESLRTFALVPVAGQSGVGKSSFVSAALAPRIEEAGEWAMVMCRPGAAPFASIAAVLGYEDVAGLRQHPSRLALALAACARARGRRLLLVVDQFEESFTLAGDDGEALCAALAQAARLDEPWRIVLTIRDDFLGRLAGPPAMRPHLGALMMLAPMTLADLRAAVVGPLNNVGYATDHEALAGRIAADVHGQPAAPALLQFTCRALWERRDADARRVLTAEYEAIGGASGALATHAERVLAELAPDQAKQVRPVLLELVAADGTRRPRPRHALEDGHLGDVGAVIDALVERRLLVSSRHLDDAEAQLEVAHEALATAWPRLARWLDETHEQRLLVAELEQATALWTRRGRRDEETWSGPALVETVRKVESWNIQLPLQSRRFLDAGLAHASRRRRVRRWLFGTVVAVLVAATILAVLVAIRLARSEREAQDQKARVIAQQERIDLAARDMGRFDLVLKPYDWNADRHEPRQPGATALRWKLFAPGLQDLNEPGREYVEGEDMIRIPSSEWQDGALVQRVEARSGRAFLEVDRGPDCSPSVIVIQQLPGFAERDHPTRLTINVPTCQATRSTMVRLEGGSFWRNVDDADGRSTHDETAALPAFWIDRTEVTRAAFRQFAVMRDITGEDSAPTVSLDADVPARPDLPVAGVTYVVARDYCRYLGKSLPSVAEWQRAFRGAATGSDPRRSTPWDSWIRDPRPANVSYRDHEAVLAPVGSFELDRSPDGIFDLAGNVSEWSTDVSHLPRFKDLRIVLGGNWGDTFAARHHRIQWRNARPDVSSDFGVGLRCALHE